MDFALANRQFVATITPTRWVAFEGDLRFSGAEAVDITNCVHARFVGIRASNTNALGSQAINIRSNSMYARIQDSTFFQLPWQTGQAEHDGCNIYQGSGASVYHNCTMHDGRHCADHASNHNFGNCFLCQWHKINWIVQPSGRAGVPLIAYGARGMGLGSIYWHFETQWGGPALTGWKMDGRWAVCNTVAGGSGGAVNLPDGGTEIHLRDTHLLVAHIWFDGNTGEVVTKSVFKNVTRGSGSPGSGNTPDTTGLAWGTGANVNSYFNVTTPVSTSWTQQA